MSYRDEKIEGLITATENHTNAITAQEARSRYGLIDLLANAALLTAKIILAAWGITEESEAKKSTSKPALRYRGDISKGTASLVFTKR